MYKFRVRLDTATDVARFVAIAESLPYMVHIIDETGNQGNAKTLFNVISSLQWKKVYIVSDEDIYTPFQNFIINET